jgi:hypothetical protein
MVPADDVVSVRSPDRIGSTLVSFGVGFGLGFGLGAGVAATSGSRASTGVVTGLFTGVVGYSFPFLHHTLYRKPQRP